jgi:hypothetical protein
MNDSVSSQSEELYSAIGKFVVAFSSFHSYAELMVSHLLVPYGDKPTFTKVQTVLNGLTTKPVVDAFFGLFSGLDSTSWSQVDQNIVTWTRKAADEIIEKRNRIAHDVWSLGHPNSPLPPDADAFRIVTKRSTKTGLKQEKQSVTVSELQLLRERTILVRDCLSLLTICGLDTSKKPSSFLRFTESGDVCKIL